MVEPGTTPPPARATGWSDLFSGLLFPFRGISFLLRNPTLWQYVLLPFLINLLVMSGLLWLTIEEWDTIVAWFTPERTAWYLSIVYWIVWVLAVLVVAVGFIFLSTFVGSLIASPFHDLLVRRTLKLLDGAEAPDLPFTAAVIAQDVWRAVRHGSLSFLIWISLQVLLLGVNFLVPAVGTIIYLVCSYATTALFQAELLLDPAMGIFRWGWRRKWGFLIGHKWQLIGFGLTTTLVPCLNYLFMPVWVVSATMAFRSYHPYDAQESAAIGGVARPPAPDGGVPAGGAA